MGEQGGEGRAREAEELTSWAMLEVAGRAPCSAGRLSLGELQPETGVLLLLGEESVPGRKNQGKWAPAHRGELHSPSPVKLALPPTTPQSPPGAKSPGGKGAPITC